jgi:hypothetical protein
VTFGFAHLRLSAASLGRLGELWRTRDPGILDPAYASGMAAVHSPGGAPEHRPYGLGFWLDDGALLAGGWAGQHVLTRPDAVVVTTGDPGFDPGPPPRDDLPPDWQPALHLIRRHLLPVLDRLV